MRTLIALLLVLAAACSRRSESPPVTKLTNENSAPDAKTGPRPIHELSVCNTDEPLSALCAVGGDAPRARFECARPHPVRFCKAVDEWCCTFTSYAGADPPPITYRATFDHHGPPVQTGAALDMSKFEKKGPVRAVEVAFALSGADGSARVKSDGDRFLAWGCTEARAVLGRTFDCGSWEAAVHYNNITKKLYVRAAERGFLECR